MLQVGQDVHPPTRGRRPCACLMSLVASGSI
jgi:hypothetical protein